MDRPEHYDTDGQQESGLERDGADQPPCTVANSLCSATQTGLPHLSPVCVAVHKLREMWQTACVLATQTGREMWQTACVQPHRLERDVANSLSSPTKIECDYLYGWIRKWSHALKCHQKW